MSPSNRRITRWTKGQLNQGQLNQVRSMQSSACPELGRVETVFDDGLSATDFTRSVSSETSSGDGLDRDRSHRLERLAGSPTLAFLGVEEASLLFEALDLLAWQGCWDDDHETLGQTGGRASVGPSRRWLDQGSSRLSSSPLANLERSSL